MRSPIRSYSMVLLLFSTAALRGEITLLGTATIPGNATDKSGLTEKLGDGTPHNRLGSMGSAIAYTGVGHRYVMLADRGPGDGATSYHCRVHVFDIEIHPGQRPAVQPRLIATTLLKTAAGQPLTGSLLAFDAENPAKSLRRDPEGIRVGKAGEYYISDEYGPYIEEYGADGVLRRSLPVPKRFQAQHPRANPAAELAANATGRLPNRGFEGLALTPDGETLVAAMQSPLIQDGGREGRSIRLLALSRTTGQSREYLYPLESPQLGLTEILAINQHVFLVLERDHLAGSKARWKRINRVDLSSASDTSAVERLPRSGIPAGVKPASVKRFLDLLAPQFGLAGPTFPEKVEGLAWGPDLPDGRHLLLVTSDNDFSASAPTLIFAFAVDAADVPEFQSAFPGR